MMRTPSSSNKLASARKEPVVAAAKKSDDSRHQPDRQPVQADLRERRPQHRADEQRLAAVFGPGETEETSSLPYRDPMVRVALDYLGIGPATHRKHHRPAAAPYNCLGDRTRKAAAAANDRYRRPPAATTAVPGHQDASSIIVGAAARDARTHQRPLAAGADERNDLFRPADRRRTRGQRLDAIGEPPRHQENAAIGAAQPVHLGSRRAAAPQADDV